MSDLYVRFDVAYPEFRLRVDFSVPGKGVTAIFGPSGSGKTTLLRCLAGLERSGTGFLQLDGEIWQDEDRAVFIPLSQRPIGYVFQEPRLFPHLNVRSNLTFGLKRIPASARRLSFEQVVEILNIGHLLDRRSSQLSGGEQQRVAIGRALLTSPRLLLMDEPLASLDFQRKQEILPFIQRLDRELGIPIVYVSHALHEVLQLARTFVLLQEGRVVTVGPLNEVFARLDLRGAIGTGLVGAVIDTTVAGHEPEFGLTRLEFCGRSLYIPQQAHEKGELLRIHVLSRDVSILAGSSDAQTSVMNVLQARIAEIGPTTAGSPFVDIKLDIGCPLLATITRKSLTALDLKPGQQVYAQIKAVALSDELTKEL